MSDPSGSGPSSTHHPPASAAPTEPPRVLYRLSYVAYKWCKALRNKLPPRSLIIDVDLQRLDYCLDPKKWLRHERNDAHQATPPDFERQDDAPRYRATERDLQQVRRALWHHDDQEQGSSSQSAERVVTLWLVQSGKEGFSCIAMAEDDVYRILRAVFPRLAQSESASKSLDDLVARIPPTETFEWAPQGATAPLHPKAYRLRSAPIMKPLRELGDFKALTKLVGAAKKSADEHDSATHGAAEFEKVQDIWYTGGCSFIAIDTESWEKGEATDLIEIGWSIIERPHGTRDERGPPFWTQKTEHRMIFEYLGMSNGRYVADARGGFLFGDDAKIVTDSPGGFVKSTTTWLPRVRVDDDTVSWEVGAIWPNKTQVQDMQHVASELDETIRRLRRKGPVYVVFHDYSADIKLLRHLGLSTSGWQSLWNMGGSGKNPGRADAARFHRAVGGDESDSDEDDDNDGDDYDDAPTMPDLGKSEDAGLAPVVVLDTRRLFAVLEGRSVKMGTKLGRMTSVLTDIGPGSGGGGIIAGLHNAANDAFYTLLSLGAMASGPPLLQHRQKIQKRIDAVDAKRAKALEQSKKDKEAWQAQGKAKAQPGDEHKKRKLDEQAAHSGWGASTTSSSSPRGSRPGSTRPDGRRPDFRHEEQAVAESSADERDDDHDSHGDAAEARMGRDGVSWRRRDDEDRLDAAPGRRRDDDGAPREAPDWRRDATTSSRAPPPHLDVPAPAPAPAQGPATMSPEAEHRIKMLEIQVANLSMQLEALTNAVLTTARTNAALTQLQSLFPSHGGMSSASSSIASPAPSLPTPHPPLPPPPPPRQQQQRSPTPSASTFEAAHASHPIHAFGHIETETEQDSYSDSPRTYPRTAAPPHLIGKVSAAAPVPVPVPVRRALQERPFTPSSSSSYAPSSSPSSPGGSGAERPVPAPSPSPSTATATVTVVRKPLTASAGVGQVKTKLHPASSPPATSSAIKKVSNDPRPAKPTTNTGKTSTPTAPISNPPSFVKTAAAALKSTTTTTKSNPTAVAAVKSRTKWQPTTPALSNDEAEAHRLWS
ncbi:uncharacterized protein PSFLO_07657 [Pseudozyma flocculosa]|uniref:Gfd2/YDR514C-like C-terminal domain-containing protein n=1 Tax=Pseudozyma flocculosa TaxID=84751 RepID=A0A5C3FCM2_9BASI|nr:uncharacterized protein PSFLO_07657 [Pseudozyma flocculosa]